MRIVDVCAFYAPSGGGVKTYVERKLRAGALAGHEVIILAPSDSDRVVEAGGGRIVMLPARRFPLDRRYSYFDDEASLHAMLDRLQPDLVEASSPWASAAMVARWRGGAPRALIMHADPLSAYAYRWFGSVLSREAIDRGFDWFWRHLRRLDERFDLVVSASDSLSRRLEAGRLRRVMTLPMGVEPGHFSPAHRHEGLRARLLERCGLGPEATLLLGVGRHAPEKRWPMVIDAVTSAGFSTPVGLVLVGDGRERGRVRRASAHNPHIQLLAPMHSRPALAELLASADALVHGCEAETFCMVAAEARASGLPVIVPDEGGASDQARSGGGLLYRAGQADSLAGVIAKFARADAVARRRAALESAPAVMTMDDHFDRLFAAYDDIAGARRHVA
ncbi:MULTISPECIES: glycosyltransferase [Sphingobium]|uniref:Glycosyl transferase n=1 Tax=Sphingobium fuliginis (strain ATCC 27551) TaxID=336203 RepID=A0A292ZI62_SPHSA|nr:MULTISPECIES: glycosyltransferase [Sphingobium]AJR24695.1 glycosyl transferase family 1 [Sphingobium sp. YBL2]RYL99399.1 glycosyltransferase [Sphingobium fuliginis]WDA36779.1 glycosyltransferase [Sphingobium sp. YC-XJ3]GAY22529.1 glycosyl transferase, group 1 [Sphingobium fuliginis]GFZ84560.1 glycosyl transferase [Sphingobium fuliginis]